MSDADFYMPILSPPGPNPGAASDRLCSEQVCRRPSGAARTPASTMAAARQVTKKPPPTHLSEWKGGAMSVKQWFRELQPLPLYLMMALTVLFFIVQLVASHVTHALTLLVDSYHTLCNLIALLGCLITVKYGREHSRGVFIKNRENEEGPEGEAGAAPPIDDEPNGCGCSPRLKKPQQNSISSERKLKNTFGWARIEVLVMLIGAVFLCSLCFSLIVEAVQTLFHIGHQDAMHYPLHVMVIGACGLLLNGFCYLLIGGYTFHQGSFLHVTADGNVVLDRDLSGDRIRDGNRQLSARRAAVREDMVSQIERCDELESVDHQEKHQQIAKERRQGPREMLRDVSSCLFVIICAAIVYHTDPELAKYIDPSLSIVSSIFLLALSVPYMKESSHILLQTIPGCMDINSLKTDLTKEFPSIENVHEVHIWCLTPTRVFATAHIVLPSHDDYVHIKDNLTEFFHDRGVTQATIQPEFSNSVDRNSLNVDECYLKCQGLGCQRQHCCNRSPTSSQEDLSDCHEGHSHAKGHGHSHGKGHSHEKSQGHSHAKGHSHDKGHSHAKVLKVKAAKKQEAPPRAEEKTEPQIATCCEESAKDVAEEVVVEEQKKEKSPVVYRRQRSQSVCDSLPNARDSFDECQITRVKQTSLIDVMHLS